MSAHNQKRGKKGMAVETLAVVLVGLLGLSGGVQADPVLDCQVAKVRAAGNRAACRAKQQEKKIQGERFNFAACEARFNDRIAAVDVAADLAGVACRYIDNGDGTVSDLNTLLMWEKKVAGGSTLYDSQGVGDCLNCVNDQYRWDTAVSEWLSALNGRVNGSSQSGGFAGFEDWRVPTHIELQAILLEPGPCGTVPCIDPIFGPTENSGTSYYWSSTTFLPPDPWVAHVVSFHDGFELGRDKTQGSHVRGVRGGRESL